MKRALEAVVVVAAVALAVFVAREWRFRRESAARTQVADPSLRPGTDAEPGAAAPKPGHPSGVVGLPMVKLRTPPRAAPRKVRIPLPPSSNP